MTAQAHIALRIERFPEASLRAALAAHEVEPGETGVRHGADGSGPVMVLRGSDGNVVALKGPPGDAAPA